MVIAIYLANILVIYLLYNSINKKNEIFCHNTIIYNQKINFYKKIDFVKKNYKSKF